MVRSAQLLRDHVLHLELVVRVTAAAIVTDPVILPVEPIPLVLGLRVVLVVAVIRTAGVGCSRLRQLWVWSIDLWLPRRLVRWLRVASPAQRKVRRLVFAAFGTLGYLAALDRWRGAAAKPALARTYTSAGGSAYGTELELPVRAPHTVYVKRLYRIGG